MGREGKGREGKGRCRMLTRIRRDDNARKEERGKRVIIIMTKITITRGEKNVLSSFVTF